MACGKSHGNSFDAKGLMSGLEYKFRVSAVNEYGDSDPTEAKETIKMMSSAEDMDNSVRNMWRKDHDGWNNNMRKKKRREIIKDSMLNCYGTMYYIHTYYLNIQ